MKKILGSSPRSTIIGYVTAALMVVIPILQSGEVDWTKIVAAVAAAVFGRLVKDSDGTNKNEAK